MLDFISQNWPSLIIAAGILVYIVYLSATRQWIKVREFAYEMMLCAERVFADDQGKLKFDFVVNFVYDYLPAWMKMFVKRETLNKLVQNLYDTAKDLLDDGEINSSIKQIMNK